MNTQAQNKLIAARTSLVLNNPFFGYLSLTLKLTEDETCETAWTDARSIGYNPQFIDSLSHDAIVGLLEHEVMHVVLGHPWRREGRDADDWNIDCDKVINAELKENGVTLPKDGYYATGDEIGKSAEWIYARRGAKPKQDKNQGGSGNGQGQKQKGKGAGFGEVKDAPTSEDADGSPIPTEADVKQKAMVAMIQAKMQGKLPASLARLVKDAIKPRLDIRALLLRFFDERSNTDYTWTRPNTRYISQGLFLPSLYSKQLGEVAIMVDTSGSVDETSLGYAREIVQSVIDECNPKCVTVYYADAKVQRVERFEQGESLTWQPKGGGGTDFRPALKAIEDDGEAICMLCITDLMGTFPKDAPSIPTLWLATTDKIAPFGETIPLDR